MSVGMTRISSVGIGLDRLGGRLTGWKLSTSQPARPEPCAATRSAPGAALVVLHAAGAPDVHPVALTLVSSDCEEHGLERVDRAVVGIDAHQKLVSRSRHGNRGLAGDPAATVRKRVSMRTGNSRNGELSLSWLTFCCGVLNCANAAVARLTLARAFCNAWFARCLIGRRLLRGRRQLRQLCAWSSLRRWLAASQDPAPPAPAGTCRGLQRGELRRVLGGARGSELGLGGSEVCHVQGLFSASISSAWTATITGCRNST